MNAKQFIYEAAKLSGLFRFAGWLTRRKLRILCYHGFALHDENSFRPKLFIRPKTFVRRMNYLKEKGIPVLALPEALERLTNGTLPSCAAVITIDDGFYSVFKCALPVLAANFFPATVYVTSYYMEKQNPIFRLAVQYIFWKTACQRLQTNGLLPGPDEELDLRDTQVRETWMWKFIEFGESECDETQRRALSEKLGIRLEVSHQDMVRSRSLSLMTAAEAKALLENGVDIQLHTHRHCFPEEREAALRELRDNDRALPSLAGERRVHFCYPSGLWSRAHWPWLKEFGIRTAVTCEAGLNTTATSPFALHRFLDGENISQIEFEAEIFGFAEILRILRAVFFRTVESSSAAD